MTELLHLHWIISEVLKDIEWYLSNNNPIEKVMIKIQIAEHGLQVIRSQLTEKLNKSVNDKTKKYFAKMTRDYCSQYYKWFPQNDSTVGLFKTLNEYVCKQSKKRVTFSNVVLSC